MVSSLLDTYPDDFIAIFYQFSNAAYQPWCSTRANFYNLQYVPRMWWGDEDGGSSSGAWEADILARRDVPTDVTMGIEGFRDGAELDVRATVCVEFGGTSRNMRVYVAQILDHHLITIDYHRNAFRQVAIEDVWVEANSCVDVQASMILKAEDLAQLSDIGVVVWAQAPKSSGPAEIFQAAYIFLVIMTDGFESGDLSGWDYVVGGN